MSITKADRDKLREILAKATFGEWYVNVWTTGRRTIQHENGVVVCEVHNTHDGNRPNAEAIIAAHNALPGLLDALDAAEKRAEKLHGILALVPGECAAMKAENKLLRVALAKMRYACECAEKWFAKHGYSPDQLTAEGVLLNELRFALRAEPEARP